MQNNFPSEQRTAAVLVSTAVIGVVVLASLFIYWSFN